MVKITANIQNKINWCFLNARIDMIKMDAVSVRV